MAGLSGGLSDIGGGIGDLFASQGDSQSAGSYDKAAAGEEVNARIAAASTRIKETALQRSIYSTEGAQSAAVTGSGFKMSGTAMDLVRDTAQQGALATSILTAQGAIDVNDYKLKADAYRAQAQQARTAAKGAGITGLISIGVGILSMFGI